MDTPHSSKPVALVAGASRGLGLLIAGELVRRGHQVAICAREQDQVEHAAQLLREQTAGAIVRPYACDVSRADQVRALVTSVESDLGPVEVLITVAGIIQVGPAESFTLEHFEQAIDTMLWGPVRLAWAVLPSMRARGHGRIGTVTSIGGKVPAPHLLPYVTAKFGAVGFAEALAAELQGSGVTSTALVPGLMRTGSHEAAQFTQPSEYAWFGPAASLPLISMRAGRAARQMVDGVLAGDPVVQVGLITQLATRVHGLAPATTVRAMGLANRLLPAAPSGGGTTTIPGYAAAARLHSPVVHTLTTLGSRAASRLNTRFGRSSTETAS